MAFCCAQSEISAQVLKSAIQTHLSCSPFILDQGSYLSSAPLTPATLVSLLHAMAGSSLWNIFSLNIHVVNSLTFLKPLLRCHLLSETYLTNIFFFFFLSVTLLFPPPFEIVKHTLRRCLITDFRLFGCSIQSALLLLVSFFPCCSMIISASLDFLSCVPKG